MKKAIVIVLIVLLISGCCFRSATLYVENPNGAAIGVYCDGDFLGSILANQELMEYCLPCGFHELRFLQHYQGHIYDVTIELYLGVSPSTVVCDGVGVHW